VTYIVSTEQSDRSVWLHSERYFTFLVGTDLATFGVDDLTHTHTTDRLQQVCTYEARRHWAFTDLECDY